jgi:hypothetical protein
MPSLDSVSAGVYRQFVVPMTYYSSEVPDTAIIQVSVLGPTGSDFHAGTTIHVDNLSFSGTVDVGEENFEKPVTFELSQNYPHPFNPSTSIRYSVQSSQHVSLRVYDVLGSEIAILVDEVKEPGNYIAVWDAHDYPSGMYFYRLRSGNQVGQKKMLLIR